MNKSGKVIVAEALANILKKEIGVDYVSDVIMGDSKDQAQFTVSIFGTPYVIGVRG